MLQVAEEFYQSLEITYRMVSIVSGAGIIVPEVLRNYMGGMDFIPFIRE